MGKDQLDDLELDGPVTLRLLDGIAWGFTQAIEVMEDREVWRLNLELLPQNPHGKAGNKERRRIKTNKLNLPKQIRKDQLDNLVLDLDGSITFAILDGIAWCFSQAK